MSAADFEPAKARCSLLARHSGSGFAAFGSEGYVVGAALGQAIGESVRTQQDFNDCMLASGWRIADQPAATASQDPRIPQLMDVKAQLGICVNTVRDKPIYAPLRSHLGDLAAGRFSMTQMADERVPTQEESQLLALYSDEIAPCADKFITAASRVLPAAGPILAKERSDARAVRLLLVKRQLTWGEAAQRQQQMAEAAVEKLRAVASETPHAVTNAPEPHPVVQATQAAAPVIAPPRQDWSDVNCSASHLHTSMESTCSIGPQSAVLGQFDCNRSRRRRDGCCGITVALVAESERLYA